MLSRSRYALLALLVAPALGITVGALPASAADGAALLAGASPLDGAALAGPTTAYVAGEGVTQVTWVLDGVWLGADTTAPYELDLRLAPGSHRLRARVEQRGGDVRLDARFDVASGAAAAPAAPAVQPVAPSAAPAVQPATSPAPAPAVAPATSSTGTTWHVDTADEVRAALASARPGDTVAVADGTYLFKKRVVAAASGTAAAPITLVGSRRAVFRTKGVSGDYGLSVTGDYWHVRGITVAHASKGIVLDGSRGTVIDGVEVYDIGAEGVHFRSCSSDGVLRDSYVHDTGRRSPQYGEGVYVGSASSNWGSYHCTDPVERISTGDNTERVLVEGNTFEDVTAEGADLKEGTDSGTLRDNRFVAAGTSGRNSADSAVDAKGNGWVVSGNTVSDTTRRWDDDGTLRPSAFADGFQAHSVVPGYGTRNVFSGNRVVGSVPGFGVGLYPQAGNVVRCDNSAPDAARGLVGNGRSAARCG
ncbi:parallel beta helix pectate lyase-like protein [Motilibacter peucedani]|uniref:Parallel beta helix pectate lyase-like protein n=1 Tax=Motilibacter peucedani TaxID=598650 RepID=A0A420XVH7_9ACTN|nr:right-handed parallel beta-helix repeat-containing protein [Motilibacter peucedani]RKS84297.1 parallel beta helix pectate lyase-like protein [Motilibacter peucedani]